MNSDSEKEDKDWANQGEIKNAIYKNLMFNKTPQDLQKIIEDLPAGLYMHLFLLLWDLKEFGHCINIVPPFKCWVTDL